MAHTRRPTNTVTALVTIAFLASGAATLTVGLGTSVAHAGTARSETPLPDPPDEQPPRSAAGRPSHIGATEPDPVLGETGAPEPDISPAPHQTAADPGPSPHTGSTTRPTNQTHQPQQDPPNRETRPTPSARATDTQTTTDTHTATDTLSATAAPRHDGASPATGAAPLGQTRPYGAGRQGSSQRLTTNLDHTSRSTSSGRASRGAPAAGSFPHTTLGVGAPNAGAVPTTRLADAPTEPSSVGSTKRGASLFVSGFVALLVSIIGLVGVAIRRGQW